MKKEKILKHLDDGIEKQVPDVWDKVKMKIQKAEEIGYDDEATMFGKVTTPTKKKTFYKKVSLAAAVFLIIVSTITFTPAFAAIQNVYDKIFSSKHIDDTGVRIALKQGHGQDVNQTFYDKKHDITVHFESVMTDDKETKLLLTYQSKTTNLKHYYLDNFEGKTSVQVIVGNGPGKTLDCVGWGSRYYNSKENKVAEALSFKSIKKYEGQDIRLEIKDLTIYEDNDVRAVQTTWPLDFTLKKSATLTRKTVAVNKNFDFKNTTYTIKQVEFSPLETRVVISGIDTKIMTDRDGNKYHIRSELEKQFLNSRKVSKEYGYTVDDQKSGVFLKSAGKKVDPIFNKDEVKGALDEYIMIFAPVKDPEDCILEVGDDIEIPLTK